MNDLHPSSWVISAGRTRRPGQPLNVPPVLASNFYLPSERVYSRTEGTETAAALVAASDADLEADWLKNGDWDPFEFVNLCSRHAASGGPPMRLCQELAQLEWCLLFDSCYRQAVAR